MAKIAIISEEILPLKLSNRTLSGNIVVSGSPVIRQVLVYKNDNRDDLAGSTYSNSSGNWSVTVIGNDNDKFHVIFVGQGDEFSKIFRGVIAG